MLDVPDNLHGNERLARLLRLLRPAPEGWVESARRIFTPSSVGDLPAAGGLTDADVAELASALERNPLFRERFDADPVAAAREVGMRELASRIEVEIGALVAVAERIANDVDYRASLTSDPMATLAAEGLPRSTVEPYLRALDDSSEALESLPEVVAHRDEPSARARAVLLLLGCSAVVARIRATTDD